MKKFLVGLLILVFALGGCGNSDIDDNDEIYVDPDFDINGEIEEVLEDNIVIYDSYLIYDGETLLNEATIPLDLILEMDFDFYMPVEGNGNASSFVYIGTDKVVAGEYGFEGELMFRPESLVYNDILPYGEFLAVPAGAELYPADFNAGSAEVVADCATLAYNYLGDNGVIDTAYEIGSVTIFENGDKTSAVVYLHDDLTKRAEVWIQDNSSGLYGDDAYLPDNQAIFVAVLFVPDVTDMTTYDVVLEEMTNCVVGLSLPWYNVHMFDADNDGKYDVMIDIAAYEGTASVVIKELDYIVEESSEPEVGEEDIEFVFDVLEGIGLVLNQSSEVVAEMEESPYLFGVLSYDIVDYQLEMVDGKDKFRDYLVESYSMSSGNNGFNDLEGNVIISDIIDKMNFSYSQGIEELVWIYDGAIWRGIDFSTGTVYVYEVYDLDNRENYIDTYELATTSIAVKNNAIIIDGEWEVSNFSVPLGVLSLLDFDIYLDGEYWGTDKGEFNLYFYEGEIAGNFGNLPDYDSIFAVLAGTDVYSNNVENLADFSDYEALVEGYMDDNGIGNGDYLIDSVTTFDYNGKTAAILCANDNYLDEEGVRQGIHWKYDAEDSYYVENEIGLFSLIVLIPDIEYLSDYQVIDERVWQMQNVTATSLYFVSVADIDNDGEVEILYYLAGYEGSSSGVFELEY